MKTLTPIPQNYLKPIANSGTVARVDYTAGSNKGGDKKTAKYAYVYLPYGYDASQKYDIIYCLHGGGGEIEVYFGSEEQPADIKLTLDSMIANGDIPPVIAVSPTYYANRRDHDLSSAVSEIERFCKNELINDLMPKIEGTYSTYAESADKEGLKASRNHRIYTGYSMGALSTWYAFLHCLDYFRYFMPMSGDCWVNGSSNAQAAAELLENTFQNSGYHAEDFFIYAVTGDRDIAYENMKSQVEAMKSCPSFQFVTETSSAGNICFCVEPEAVHDYIYMPLYFYNALPVFLNRKTDSPKDA